MARDRFIATHFLGQRFAPNYLIDLKLPTHKYPLYNLSVFYYNLKNIYQVLFTNINLCIFLPILNKSQFVVILK